MSLVHGQDHNHPSGTSMGGFRLDFTTRNCLWTALTLL